MTAADTLRFAVANLVNEPELINSSPNSDVALNTSLLRERQPESKLDHVLESADTQVLYCTNIPVLLYNSSAALDFKGHKLVLFQNVSHLTLIDV